MSRPVKDLKGMRFGRLVAVHSFYDTWMAPDGNKRQVLKWHCQCDCGGTATPTGSKLTKGETNGCHLCKYERLSATNKAKSEANKEYHKKKKEGTSTMGTPLTRPALCGTLHALVHLNQLFTNPIPVTNPEPLKDSES